MEQRVSLIIGLAKRFADMCIILPAPFAKSLNHLIVVVFRKFYTRPGIVIRYIHTCFRRCSVKRLEEIRPVRIILYLCIDTVGCVVILPHLDTAILPICGSQLVVLQFGIQTERTLEVLVTILVGA